MMQKHISQHKETKSSPLKRINGRKNHRTNKMDSYNVQITQKIKKETNKYVEKKTKSELVKYNYILFKELKILGCISRSSNVNDIRH